MKNTVKIAITTLVSALLVAPNLAFSHENGTRVHDRLQRQQQRIERGVENGALTRQEAKKLKKEQRKIRKLARNFRSDGKLSRTEKAKLHKKLDRAGKRIWKLKHNDRVRNHRYQHSYAYQEPRQRWNDHSAGSWNWRYQDNDHRSHYFYR